MDFNQSDIHQFLLENIPSRFVQLSSPEFGEFMEYLFRRDGYEIRHHDRIGEFSNVLLALKGESLHAIMPFRLDPDMMLDERDVRKALQAGVFFNADQTWIITNSSIVTEARDLADTSDMEVWDWDALYDALCKMFFDGQSVEEFMKENPILPGSKEIEPELKLKVRWQAAEGITPEWFNLGMTVTNPTDQNLYIHLELPALIDSRKNQVMADQWGVGEFDAGMIYAGASIRTNALFSVARLGDRPPGGRIVMTCHERRDTPVTYHLHARLKGEACYFVTYCYGRDSRQYRDMIFFRDRVLASSFPGRMLIRFYYFISPRMIDWAIKNRMMDTIIRIITMASVVVLRKSMNRNTTSKSHPS